MINKPILCDVDGVLADFHEPVIDYMFDRWGIKVDRNEVTTDIRKYAPGLWDEKAENYIRSAGFAMQLKPIPGAVETVKKIMEKHEVVFVTAPYIGSPTWDHDRRGWLQVHFGINKNQLIFAHNKKLIHGVTLVDDKWENILQWSNTHKTTGILYQQPWNKVSWDKLPFTMHNGLKWIKIQADQDNMADFFVVQNWEEAVEALSQFAHLKEKQILV